MRKLKLEMQVSIDGFTADREGSTDWMVWGWTDDWSWDEALRRYHIDLTMSSDCILLSRKMAEEGFHDHWEKIAGDSTNPQSAFAGPITDMRKLVFSKTLEKSRWKNTELAKGDLVAEVSRLKHQQGKDIVVYGGPTFASALMEAGLIDEFHLFVNPAILGTGRSMFSSAGCRANLKLQNARPFDCGVVVLDYIRA